MNRRRFLQLLGITSAAAAIPAGELWVPGEKRIFLPPRGGWNNDYAYVSSLPRCLAGGPFMFEPFTVEFIDPPPRGALVSVMTDGIEGVAYVDGVRRLHRLQMIGGRA